MRDPTEIVLERVGDALRHGLGAGSRQLGGYCDGREVYLRQRRDRQLEKCEKPGQSKSNSKKRRSNRPRDEKCGEASFVDLADGERGRRPPIRQSGGEAIEIEVDDGRREKRHRLAQDQAANDRHAERLA